MWLLSVYPLLARTCTHILHITFFFFWNWVFSGLKKTMKRGNLSSGIPTSPSEVNKLMNDMFLSNTVRTRL